MFLICGTRTVSRDVKHRALERGHCARCGLVSDFRAQRRRDYFTLFFLPVFPISKADAIVTCTRCQATYYDDHRESAPSPITDPGGKAVLECPACHGKLRVPVKRDNAIRVTCPHCRDQFTVSVDA